MKKVLLLCLMSLFSFSFQGFSQGLETFDNFSEGNSYNTGSFSGQDGSTWNYVGSRGDLSIDGSSITLGKSSTAAVTSGTISGGCSVISFDYQQAYSGNVNLELLINGTVITTVTTSGEQGTKKSSGELAVNATGDFTIGFAQATGGKQVIIDNISWTGNAGSGNPTVEKPVLSIETGIYMTAQSVSITSGTPDAEIFYTIDGTAPTDASALYENAIAVSTTTTLKAIAYKAGMTESSVASATYSFPVNVATVAELRGGLKDGTVYTLTGEVLLVFQQSSRNQKVVQDATGGILIDDTGAKITTVYNLNDGITGLTGALTEYNGLLQFIPSMDPGVASSNDNAVLATEVTISDLKASWSMYESKLVKLSNVSFGAKAGDKFADGQNYTLTDNGANEIVLRTNFRGTDLIDNVVPGSANVVGVAAIFNGTHQIIPRGAADISGVSTAVNDVVKQQVSISPNPFQNTIKVASDSKVVSVAFYNSVGQLVKEVDTVDLSISTAELAKGLYIIQLTFEDGSVATQKVTKK